ncbi:hypothetical protein ACIGO9_31430 [Nocardia asteroides]|uniref:hypothetical protein n=1 Tax=Nocardia asteroides TaxID=1824 RepID=UPI0037C4F98D
MVTPGTHNNQQDRPTGHPRRRPSWSNIAAAVCAGASAIGTTVISGNPVAGVSVGGFVLLLWKEFRS